MTGERLANAAARPHGERGSDGLPVPKPRSEPSVRAELAAAVRAVNAAFARLPAEAQAAIDPTTDPCEREIEAAMQAGDRDRAMAAVRAWRGYWLAEIERAGS